MLLTETPRGHLKRGRDYSFLQHAFGASGRLDAFEMDVVSTGADPHSSKTVAAQRALIAVVAVRASATAEGAEGVARRVSRDGRRRRVCRR